MIRKISTLALATLASFSALAGVKVTSLDLKTNEAIGYVNISLEGRSPELPDVRVFGKTIEITLTGADPFSAITKNVRGAQLSANVLNGKAIIKAILPYEVNPNGVDLGWKNKNIEVVFPRGTVAHVETDRPTQSDLKPVPAPVQKPQAKTVNKILAKVESTVSKDALNEDYLNNLMKEETKTARRDTDFPPTNTNEDKKADEVNVQQSGIARIETVETKKTVTSSTEKFSFTGYAVKFVVFLAMVLGLFYGIVQLLKKGVFNKGKLGFLNNTQMIQVLSTQYVAPKRSLMVVKAHKQIFLVANSENGLQFLSEMTDTSGLMKEGEKFVTGTNFDLNLGSAETTTSESAFKIKENINESTPVPEEKGIAALSAKDIVKFSDELKKKARKLKPIEFN